MYYYLLRAAAEIILIAAGGYPDNSFRILPSPRALHLSTTGRLASPNNEINTTSQIMRSPAVGKRSGRCAACCHRSALFPRGGGLGLMNSLAHGPGVETPPRLKYHSDMQTSAARGFGVARQIGLNYGAACWCVCMNMRPLLLSLAPRSLHS
jgi:hypothetical protein